MNHDPQLCFCGYQTECVCPCDDCAARRDALSALHCQQGLLEILEELGIDIDCLTDLVWMRIEPEIEKRIENLVQMLLRERLRKIILRSTVEWGQM